MNIRSLSFSIAAITLLGGLCASPLSSQSTDAKIIPEIGGESKSTKPQFKAGSPPKRVPFDGPRPNRWFESTQVDLGTFLEGETAVGKFRFTNPDDADYLIKSVTPNCQCAKAKISVGDRHYVIENNPVPNTIYRLDGPEPAPAKDGEKGKQAPRTKVKHIAVGAKEEGLVEMHLSLKGVTGVKEAFITMRTDDPLLPTPRVVARAKGVNFFTVRPPQINLNKMTWDQKREFSFEVSSDIKPDFEVTDVTTSAQALKVTSKTKLERNGQTFWKISGQYGPDVQPRAGGGVLKVQTNLRDAKSVAGKSVDVRVIAVVEGPLTVKPGTFLPLGRVRAKTGKTTSVEFVPNNDFDLQFAEVKLEKVTARLCGLPLAEAVEGRQDAQARIGRCPERARRPDARRHHGGAQPPVDPEQVGPVQRIRSLTDVAALERVLLAAKIVESAQLDKARAFAQSRGVPLERALTQLDLATEEKVYRALAKASGMKFVDPAAAKPEALQAIPAEQVEQNHALPILTRDGALWVAIDDPVKVYVADNLAFFAGCDVQCALAPPTALKEAIRRHVGGASAADAKAGAGGVAVDNEDPDAPIIRLVEKLIEDAVNERASDIHIEPYENSVRVRYRVDGVLKDHSIVQRELQGPLSSRLKIMAALDIAEKRKPQDGRIEVRVGGRAIDIRASVLPSNHGETLVMRLLDKEQNLLSLEALGFGGEDRERFDRIIKRPNGVFLVTGPTGSGKTTTLYAALKQLNRSDVKIITAEDPVEFNLAGINQCQVRSHIGLDFARILRAMLRQAPNVILVGEIRDRETAEIAIQAALTGHLVFSTLHTNDAPSAVTRLIDMQVKPFLVSAAIQGVLAQRLVRVLCDACKQPHHPSSAELRIVGIDPERASSIEIFRPHGCDACDQTGYRGRVGIFELMSMDENLRDMTFRGEATLRIRDYARTSRRHADPHG